MKYNGIIENKLRIIEEKVEMIHSWNIDSFQKLQSNSMLQSAVERTLQVAVEAMIDIAERILAMYEIQPQNSSTASMNKLKELKILSDPSDYEEMIRFRNFIVHRYDKIDLEIVYNISSKMLPRFNQFVDEIRKSYGPDDKF
jgi:uncharacterized protein YutE (UPF0331/DUF86 family)